MISCDRGIDESSMICECNNLDHLSQLFVDDDEQLGQPFDIAG